MQLKSRQEELMRAIVGIAVACLVIAAPLLAQEGHPLVGSWHGDRGPNAATRSAVTLIMDWDGSVISGLVNPGYEHAALQNAKLNPKDWSVHFEVEIKDKSGKSERCIVDGKLDKLGSDRRTLTGSWTCGATKNDFKLTRDRDYYHTIGETK
jgi:hypothetical protein